MARTRGRTRKGLKGGPRTTTAGVLVGVPKGQEGQSPGKGHPRDPPTRTGSSQCIEQIPLLGVPRTHVYTPERGVPDDTRTLQGPPQSTGSLIGGHVERVREDAQTTERGDGVGSEGAPRPPLTYFRSVLRLRGQTVGGPSRGRRSRRSTCPPASAVPHCRSHRSGQSPET